MISKKEVEKLAFLGRVELTEEELDNTPEELESILKYVQKLSEVDTEKTEPFFHFPETKNIVREDVSTQESDYMKEEMKKTKKHKNNYLKVNSIWG
jgi:aspartyl-tRNA(Asn)/glutamyl-tRNA(Gln) amidotransferase subunit C